MADALRRRAGGLAGALLTAAALAGCSFTPPYSPPAPPPVAAFKEGGPFTLALPADTLAPGAWWNVYHDPVLDDLEQRVTAANPTLAGALAAYDQANAFIGEARAGLGVQATAGGTATYNRQSDNRPLRGRDQPNEYAANTVSGSIGYEVDIWGRVRSLVASATDLAQASSDDVAGVKLALQTQLAQTYFRLREQDAEIVLLRNTVAAYQRADNLVETRHSGGIASGLEVSRARAQLASARAQVNDAAAQRALYEHAIASLVGQPASTFAVALDARTDAIVTPPVGVPSTLLQRRPDVAAAERRIAA
ncbi:MAG: TolC family protein, partial [Caulobacteraceae bacterium]|nr:TolC family protein [Caulobacter sp.]